MNRSELSRAEKALLDTSQTSLSWPHAVDAASARLNEEWVMPETGSHPAVEGMGQELAALLCAYGMLGEESDRMRGRETEP